MPTCAVAMLVHKNTAAIKSLIKGEANASQVEELFDHCLNEKADRCAELLCIVGGVDRWGELLEARDSPKPTDKLLLIPIFCGIGAPCQKTLWSNNTVKVCCLNALDVRCVLSCLNTFIRLK